jgi:hypothetical protein
MNNHMREACCTSTLSTASADTMLSCACMTLLHFTILHSALQVGNDKPVVISKFILNAKEIEFDGVRALHLSSYNSIPDCMHASCIVTYHLAAKCDAY